MHFGGVLAALLETGYAGVVAAEPFDYVPDGMGAAAWAAGYLRGLLERLPVAAGAAQSGPAGQAVR